jgi:hypothetical protein
MESSKTTLHIHRISCSSIHGYEVKVDLVIEEANG